MPERLVRKGWEIWKKYAQAVLLVLLACTLVVAIWGWSRATSAETRISQVELEQEAERVAQEASKKAAAQSKRISQVVTCFTAARGRPLLTTILRALAGRETDPLTRAAYEILIDDYEDQPVAGVPGRPTREKCVALGERLRVDYSAYDFDPETGKLLNPNTNR